VAVKFRVSGDKGHLLFFLFFPDDDDDDDGNLMWRMGFSSWGVAVT
jgi:hypothetical protein